MFGYELRLFIVNWTEVCPTLLNSLLHQTCHGISVKFTNKRSFLKIDLFWTIPARWPRSIGVLESWLSMTLSSSEVPASSILRIPSPEHFVPGCGKHLQEFSASLCSEHTYSDVFHSQDSFPSTFRPQLWETSSGVVAVGVFAAEALWVLILWSWYHSSSLYCCR